MDGNDAICAALAQARVSARIVGTRDLSGGCIHRVQEIRLSDGSNLVAKLNQASSLPLFQEEAHGLRALAATNTVLTPQPLAVCVEGETAALLMTAIESDRAGADAGTWRTFGEELAALHGSEVTAAGGNPRTRYGFDIDNHIGSTLQPNAWHDDWVEFNRVNRLGFQIDLASSNGLIDEREHELLLRVVERLDEWIPRTPKPALLHGDLWSGNALPAKGGRIAVIDPACSIGDGWADIAMMLLFGGFPQACFETYAANAVEREAGEARIAVYQLYHVLNHLNLFGRGYAAQVMNLVQRLTAR